MCRPAGGGPTLARRASTRAPVPGPGPAGRGQISRTRTRSRTSRERETASKRPAYLPSLRGSSAPAPAGESFFCSARSLVFLVPSRVYLDLNLGLCLGQLVRVSKYSPRGPGLETRKSRKNTRTHVFTGCSRIEYLTSSLKQSPAPRSRHICTRDISDLKIGCKKSPMVGDRRTTDVKQQLKKTIKPFFDTPPPPPPPPHHASHNTLLNKICKQPVVA